ncbi:MAG: ankyrin repeat domain-containing protein [Limnohabitans sp.]
MYSFKLIKKSIVFIGFLWISSASFAGAYDDFFKAIQLDDVQTVRALLQRGFDPNTLDERGRPALLLALQAPSPKVSEALIRQPQTRVELRNDKDESPLMMAALRGQKALVELLIWRDADVNKTGWTPLHYAASGGHAQIAQLLLDHSAYIDAESPNGTTPLMMAAMYGTPEVVKLLLSEGADRDLKNLLGMTALDFAKQASRKDAIELLQAPRAASAPAVQVAPKFSR